MNSRLLAIFISVSLSTVATAYEWKSHNSMAFHARRVARLAETDAQFRSFLDSFGEKDLDTRAGTPYDPHGLFGTDEDYLEIIEHDSICVFEEKPCRMFNSDWSNNALLASPLLCSKDHFHPPLDLPIPRQDAITHANWYFELAVRLYKAGKCNVDATKQRRYFRWAARALGHALHLVHDMGSPQHVQPENHLPFGLGHGPSFLETWTLKLWDDSAQWNDLHGGLHRVGTYEQAAAKAAKPTLGLFPEIMSGLADKAKPWPWGGNPWPPNSSEKRTLKDAKDTVESLHWSWPSTEDNEGSYAYYRLSPLTADMFPDFAKSAAKDSSVHRYYGKTYDFQAEPDRALNQVPPPEMVKFTLTSVEMSTRFWAEANPPVFDEKLGALITHATEAAASAILAFWERVKGDECGCEDADPCAAAKWAESAPAGGPKTARAGASVAPPKGVAVKPTAAQFCPLPPPVRPHPPGRDNPDDTQGIVSNVSAVKTASVAQFDSVELGRHWRQIAAVGVEKGFPSLVDFGRTMRLLELAQDQTLTDTGKDEIARGMAEMERKYSVHRPRPEDDLPRAAHVGVLENGFAGEAASALDALGWTHVTVPITFDPLQLAEDQKVLLIPSGGLYGTSGSADLKERLRERSTAQQITSPKQPVAAALT